RAEPGDDYVRTSHSVGPVSRNLREKPRVASGSWREKLRIASGSGVLQDVGDSVSHGLEVLHLIVWDLYAELLLGRYDDLDHGERVDIEVLGERLLLGHVIGVDPGDLFEDLGEASGGFVTGPGVLVALFGVA